MVTTAPRSACRRSARVRAAAFALLVPLAVSCGAAGPGGAPREAPPFAVAFGVDGIAMTDGNWIEKIPITVTEVSIYRGEAVGLDASRAAVVAGDQIAVMSPGRPATVADCADCAGIAATDEFIVSTRKNYTPGEGFEILLFSHDGAPVRSIAARRLEERVTTTYPAENTESPITLAADPDRVTVGYLARAGGVRAGPSIVAQYDYQGNLLAHVSVAGILGRSAVSPDGRLLALGVGGSSGACVTTSEPFVVDLQSLQVRPIEPRVPAAVIDDSGSFSEPWFLLTDLIWRDTTLLATGEVHELAAEESCDPDPEVWQRSFEPAAGRLVDTPDLGARAIRWVGPDCDHLLAITARWEDSALVRTTAGPEQRLGGFYRISLGRPVPADCLPTP
jgi:hypothetical protein